jgi:ferrochelatase
MPSYLTEPTYRHGSPALTGVLLINLGTPEAPSAPAVRRYLGEFLADPRVVEIPRPLWWLILHGIILNVRPRRSAAKYASVWTSEGSPLKVHVERQAKLLRGRLGLAGQQVRVDYAMRYGEPSIPATLSRLKAAGCTRLLLLPLYPAVRGQYHGHGYRRCLRLVADCPQPAGSTHGQEFRRPPGLHRSPGRQRSRALGEQWPADQFVSPGHEFSRAAALHARSGRPLPLRVPEDRPPVGRGTRSGPEQYQICFQSRFGRAEWLQPYTAPTLRALARQGVQKVDVICPGFPADCLETLEEIAIEGKATFIEAGGREYNYVACLNERDDWIGALADIAATTCRAGRRRLAPDLSSLELSALRARALGAPS